MIEIELVPDKNHCIETVARKEYQALVKACFTDEKEFVKHGQKVEVLRVFLESADFRRLRRDSEAYLSKGCKVKFVLYSEQSALTCRLFVDECDTAFYRLSEDSF